MALYNGGYPATYQPMYVPQYQQQPMQVQQPQQQNNGILWVQGEAGAKSYLVAPNNTVQLWDSESQTIYLKSADASGMPSMKILDYTIRDATQPTVQIAEQYATKEDLESMRQQINDLQRELDSMTKRRRAKEVTDDE